MQQTIQPTLRLPCLLVRQPYASLIVYGRKRWEFRTYNTNKRGPILIAASRGGPLETADQTLNLAARNFPRGVVLGSARLARSVPVTGSEIIELSRNAVVTRIGLDEFLTADSPIGEPMADIQNLDPAWGAYSWQMDGVTPLAVPVPLTTRPCSAWTTEPAATFWPVSGSLRLKTPFS